MGRGLACRSTAHHPRGSPARRRDSQNAAPRPPHPHPQPRALTRWQPPPEDSERKAPQTSNAQVLDHRAAPRGVAKSRVTCSIPRDLLPPARFASSRAICSVLGDLTLPSRSSRGSGGVVTWPRRGGHVAAPGSRCLCAPDPSFHPFAMASERRRVPLPVRRSPSEAAPASLRGEGVDGTCTGWI